MRVRVLKQFTAYWNYAITQFNEGAELDGDQARHFADNAPKGSVEVLEADPEPAPAPEPESPAEPVQPVGDEPPVDGTIDDLMAWVNDDPERAAQALEAEQAKDKPRSTVVKRLTALADTEE
ncbi:hypothetical protein ACFXKI_01190 [Streptomyces mirabilis]|uniref:hypothetical protein n=1 Tax=Streptomyces mirabilis TaxID=68239 RepID=UPI0036D004AA